MTASAFDFYVRQRGVFDRSRSHDVRSPTLSPSLLADLDRFSHRPEGADPLEVLAACVRHARPLVLFLEMAGRVLPLRLFPSQGLFACPVDFLRLPHGHLWLLRVIRVEPGVAYRPAFALDRPYEPEFTGPLPLLLWQAATQVQRFELLPEITGRVCYRVSPTLAIDLLPADDAAVGLLQRMRKECLALDDMAAVPGIGLERACRLLNAVYLQAGLMTLRSSPASRQSSLLWGLLGSRR